MVCAKNFSQFLLIEDGNDRKLIKIKALSKEKVWHFTISDNGIGIEAEDYHKIFKMFHRLQATNGPSGNGAGLAHCQKIVELHQGEIWVDSIVDKGSTFHFTINKHLNAAILN